MSEDMETENWDADGGEDGWGDEDAGDGDDGWGDATQDANGDDGWGDDDGDGTNAQEDKWEEELKLPNPSQPTLTRAHSFVVLNSQTLHGRQEELIRKTAELLFISKEEASCLLRHYQWKNEKLQEDWFLDQDKVRKKVGLHRDIEAPSDPSTQVQCESAFCDIVPVSEAKQLNCGHWFCNECWQAYLVSQISNGRTCVFSTCMGMACKKDHPHKFGCACNEMIPERFFTHFVTDKELMIKYDRWVLDSFVEGQRTIAWCPKPQCTNAIDCRSGGGKEVACTCGHLFCFSCSQDAHVPAPCDLVAKWLEKEQSDEATEVWLNARTKKCPNCGVRIEKNRACNHMKCVKCNHDFCWLCKGPWSQHGSSTGGYYVCNKYNEDAQKGVYSAEEKGIRDNTKLLQKYTFYYKRFKDSQHGIECTHKLWERIEKEITPTDFPKYSFLQDAIHKLVDARRVLQWTYAMAYYIKGGHEKRLFEFQQDMLVDNTERLQDLMENNEAEGLLSKRKNVIDLIGAIDKFRREMVAAVEKGDFEALLLSHPDLSTGSTWSCVICTKEQKNEDAICKSCGACRIHGEQECKACQKRQ